MIGGSSRRRVTAVTAFRVMCCYSLELARTIDARQSAMLHFRSTMIRRLFILAFVLSIACNAIGAVSPHMEGDGGCGADCCRAARHNGPKATAAKLCCLTQCKQAAETQAYLPTSLLSSRQDDKSLSLSVITLDAMHLVRSLESASSSAHLVVYPTHIYLSTGALLI